jgi:hypothetical protein
MPPRESIVAALLVTGICVALGNGWPQAGYNLLSAYVNYNNPQMEYIAPGQTGQITGIKNG